MRKKICLTPEEQKDLLDLIKTVISNTESPELAIKAQKALEALENLIPVTESEYRDLFWTKPNIKRIENCIKPQIGECCPKPGLEGICEHCNGFSRGFVYGGIEGKIEQMRKEASGEAEKERKELAKWIKSGLLRDRFGLPIKEED